MKRSPEGTLNQPFDSHVAPDRKPHLLTPLALCKGKSALGFQCRNGARQFSLYCRWHQSKPVEA